MTAVARTVVVTQPVGWVWTFLADFTTSEEWDPPTLHTERLHGDGGVGTTYHNVSKFGGQRLEIDFEVIERAEESRIVLHGLGARVAAVLTLDLQSTSAGGTRVTYDMTFTAREGEILDAAFQPEALDVVGDFVAESLADSLEHLSTV